uniref:Uncharacterized protein n=1 Tax=Theileria parva TaxID=5875 RepID=Q4N1S9_THEPA|eukprot:XP_764286.1 hypothetical protein [Theileria parva strain Muguga]
MIFIYIYCILQICSGIKFPTPNSFGYSFVKSDKQKEKSADSPVYLFLPPPEPDQNANIIPKDVNVVNNNNYDEIITGLKSKVFTNEPTLINFIPDVKLSDKNTVTDNKVISVILKMSEMVLLSDRVIVPIDFTELMKTGCCGSDRLKLLGLVMLAVNMQHNYSPKLHFVVYNYNTMEDKFYLNSYEKEYVNRQKSEITGVLKDFLSSFSKILKELFVEDLNYFSLCSSDIKDEFDKKVRICENIENFSSSIHEVKKTKFNVGEFNQIVGHSDLYTHLLNIHNSSYTKFLQKLKQLVGQEVNINNVKKSIDTMVSQVLSDYDNQVKQSKDNFKNDEVTDKIYSEMKNRFVKSIQHYLYLFNQNLIMNIISQSLNGHEQDLKKLKVTPSLDEDLSNLINKYDSQYCKNVKKVKYSILDSYKLYDAVTKSFRFDLILSLRDYSNGIMEKVIRLGNYYHEFSIIDGLRFTPSENVVGFIKKIISKINIPLKIRISYLSPTAFGFSNLFK